MADAVMIIDSFGENRAKVATELAKELGIEVSEAITRVESRKPIFRKALFDRQTPLFAERLLNLMHLLDNLGCKWRAYELTKGRVWGVNETFFELNTEILSNIISCWHKSLEEQRRFGELEAGLDDEAL